MKLSKLKYNPENPRRISPDQLDKLVKSIESLPKMMELRPIVYDPNTMYVLGGNQRLAALRKMGKTEIPDNWVKSTDEMTDKEKREFVLRDNVQSGEWDYSVLDENFADFDLDDIGIELPEMLGESKNAPTGITLSERFIIPPFTILDARQGYWQERKKMWLSMGIKSDKGRKTREDGHTCASKDLMLMKKGGMGALEDANTSIFDPVLCEITYRWFTTANSKILDPFAGGSVRGIVASLLGHKYTGVDLSEEQVEANYQQINIADKNSQPVWICEDSINIDKIAKDEYDVIFTCPPYADLEVYSEKENDISNMSYDKFIDAYNEILCKSVSMLKANAFAVIVIGDVRDKKGFYRNLVSDTISAMKKAGAMLYNEAIYITPAVTLPMRTTKQFQSGRKLGKTHQNYLVFYKGDPSHIKTMGNVECGEIDEKQELVNV